MRSRLIPGPEFYQTALPVVTKIWYKICANVSSLFKLKSTRFVCLISLNLWPNYVLYGATPLLNPVRVDHINISHVLLAYKLISVISSCTSLLGALWQQKVMSYHHIVLLFTTSTLKGLIFRFDIVFDFIYSNETARGFRKSN